VQRLTKLNLRMLPQKGTGLLIGTAGARRFGRPRTYAQRLARHPVNISVAEHLSESQVFNILPYLEASGYVYAIRVQDIARDLWFNWDRGVGWYPSTPEVTVGIGTLYIAAYVTNGGGDGDMRLVIGNPGDIFADKTQFVVAGGSFGAETGTLDMPNSVFPIIIQVTP